jgi:hypothetical protein
MLTFVRDIRKQLSVSEGVKSGQNASGHTLVPLMDARPRTKFSEGSVSDSTNDTPLCGTKRFPLGSVDFVARQLGYGRKPSALFLNLDLNRRRSYCLLFDPSLY